MQSEIVGALSPPVSKFKPAKPVINFQASAIPTNYKEMEKKHLTFVAFVCNWIH